LVVKARKDVEQSAALIRILAENRSDELEQAFEEAIAQGLSWRDHISHGVRRLPADAQNALKGVIH